MPFPVYTRNNNRRRYSGHKTYAKYAGREEWMRQNDDRIREFWNAMRHFLDHNNSNLLNVCSYEALCEFMADNSLHFDDRD